MSRWYGKIYVKKVVFSPNEQNLFFLWGGMAKYVLLVNPATDPTMKRNHFCFATVWVLQNLLKTKKFELWYLLNHNFFLSCAPSVCEPSSFQLWLSLIAQSYRVVYKYVIENYFAQTWCLEFTKLSQCYFCASYLLWNNKCFWLPKRKWLKANSFNLIVETNKIPFTIHLSSFRRCISGKL